MNKTVQKEEAVKRLETLISQGIVTDLDILENFTKNDTLYFSEPQILFGEIVGVVHPLTASKRYTSIVLKFQEEHEHLLPYFVMASNTTQFGWIVAILYVSANEKEWAYDRKTYLTKKQLPTATTSTMILMRSASSPTIFLWVGLSESDKTISKMKTPHCKAIQLRSGVCSF